MEFDLPFEWSPSSSAKSNYPSRYIIQFSYKLAIFHNFIHILIRNSSSLFLPLNQLLRLLKCFRIYFLQVTTNSEFSRGGERGRRKRSNLSTTVFRHGTKRFFFARGVGGGTVTATQRLGHTIHQPRGAAIAFNLVSLSGSRAPRIFSEFSRVNTE